jgi:hypothetical protein
MSEKAIDQRPTTKTLPGGGEVKQGNNLPTFKNPPPPPPKTKQ